MSSILVIVAKAVFEKLVKEHGGAGAVGDVLGIDRYTSTHKALAPLAEGGALFMVTVRPPDEALWLVGILEEPRLGADGWTAAPSTIAVTDVGALKGELKFASGAGITAKPGALGMSLQTPRVLTDDDVARLRAAAGSPARATPPAAPPPPITHREPPAPRPLRTANPPQPLASPTGPLAAIDAALVAGDTLVALDAALAAWRTSRAPALGDLVDAIAARVTGEPITTDAAWTAAARDHAPAQVGRLLAAIPALAASFLPAVGGALAELPPDPRVAMAIATIAQDPPTTSSSNHKFWTTSIDALGRIGDPRTLPLIARRLALPQAKSAGHTTGGAGVSQFWPKFYNLLTKAQKKITAAPPVAVDAAAVAALARRAAALPVTAAATRPASIAAVPTAEGPPLAQAVTHLGAGRVGPAIDAMLVAWRAHKLPALADLIDRASRLLPAFDRVLPVDPKEAHAAWLAAFAADPLANLPLLLHGIHAGGATAVERHVIDLASLPDDPRIALRLTEVAPFATISPERSQYWKSLLEVIGRIGDVRTAAPLRYEYRDFTNTYYDNYAPARKYVRALALTPPVVPPPDAAMHKQLAALAAALDALDAARDPTEGQLLDAIAADWADDAPRMAYADWLSEREHPRGELIVLSCRAAAGTLSDEGTQRLRDLGSRLVRVHGAISEVEHVLERGIPVALTAGYAQSGVTWQRIADEPLVRFVTQLTWQTRHDAPRAEAIAAVMRSPLARALTTVTAHAPSETHNADDLEPLVAPAWKRTGLVFERAAS